MTLIVYKLKINKHRIMFSLFFLVYEKEYFFFFTYQTEIAVVNLRNSCK
jgi:hypothetical protein